MSDALQPQAASVPPSASEGPVSVYSRPTWRDAMTDIAGLASGFTDDQGGRIYDIAIQALADHPAALPSRGAEGVSGEVSLLLTDPAFVHINMMRGGIAKLSPAQVGHLYRGADAAAVVAEVIRQNPDALSPSVTGAGETVTTAAVRSDGVIVTVERPLRHGTCINFLHHYGLDYMDQGFLTSAGRFVDRQEAGRIAKAAGQGEPRAICNGNLFSEDLWDEPNAPSPSRDGKGE